MIQEMLLRDDCQYASFPHPRPVSQIEGLGVSSKRLQRPQGTDSLHLRQQVFRVYPALECSFEALLKRRMLDQAKRFGLFGASQV